MKLFVILSAFIISTSAFSRQYIQCRAEDHDATDVAVLNLQTEEDGTLMISPGVEYDEHILMNIAFDKIENSKHYFKLEGRDGHVSLPSEMVGKSTNQLKIDLDYSGYKISYLCFSRIYSDDQANQ